MSILIYFVNFSYYYDKHNVDFCKNEPRIMHLSIFRLNRILMLLIKNNLKQFLFFM